MSSPLIDMMPFAKSLGINLLEAAAERVVAELIVREDLCTVGNSLHGGAIMAFADSLGGIAGFLALPEGAKGTTTIESKTNFLGGAKVGDVVRGETVPLHRGKRTSVWQTSLSANGKPVAIVIQTQMVLT